MYDPDDFDWNDPPGPASKIPWWAHVVVAVTVASVAWGMVAVLFRAFG